MSITFPETSPLFTYHSLERLGLRGVRLGLEQLVYRQRLLPQLPDLHQTSVVSISCHYQGVCIFPNHKLELNHMAICQVEGGQL